MWYENAIYNLCPNMTYRRADIVAALKKENAGLNENSYIWLIGDLVKRGLLTHEGRNRYSLTASDKRGIYSPLYSRKAVEVLEEVKKKYPHIVFTIFESTLLNEFLNHQIARDTIFVQAERDASAFVFDFLREKSGATVLYRPSREEYRRYWQPASLVVLDCTSEAPLFRESPHEITLEKMLVDIFSDKVIRMTYSEAEYKTVVASAYERYNVDTVKLLRYARRRNREKEIRVFIPETQRVVENAFKG